MNNYEFDLRYQFDDPNQNPDDYTDALYEETDNFLERLRNIEKAKDQ